MKRKYILSAGLIGIIFMMLGQLSFSINDTLVKEIVIDSSNNMSVINVIFLRGLITTLLIFIFLIFYEKKNILTILKFKKYHQRGIYEVLTAIFFFTGLILLPVAEVYTLLMTNPFFVTIFAFLFLKEKVGVRRWGAVAIGFIGVIFVVNPQNVNFNFLYIFPIIAAIFLTIRDIATKGIATKTNSFEIIFITSILMTLFSGIGSLFFEFTFKIEYLPNLLISSILITIAYIFSVLTIFYAPLSLTASARYSVIVFGMIFGYLVLNEIPSTNMIVGAIIISLSGLFVIRRQKKLGKIE
jgi:drug/metabolite transporter (DMT)-like permease